MFLGIDVGTSGVKVVLTDEEGTKIDQAFSPLSVSQPHPRWSEQNPEHWWSGVEAAVMAIRHRKAQSFEQLRAIGLSGQMHGATLLDDSDRPLRPAILWNDGRSSDECGELEAAVPDLHEIAGNQAMPGFTAPKVSWVRKNESHLFPHIHKVLLPKDYVRLKLTGDHASDPSDSAGTLWLNIEKRKWSRELLAATGLSEDQMPRLHEGSEATGTVRPKLAERWGISRNVVVAGGGGDNAAGAVGVGVVEEGSALLSLGTSGVYFTASDHYAANPKGGVHSFCHCLPGRWHQMSVILSAASCLSWMTRASGAANEEVLLREVEEEAPTSGDLLFLPYLSGERTPHNDPSAQGVFFGITHSTTRAMMARAVLEGVAFAFADGQDALLAAGCDLKDLSVIGGGAQSRLWGEILASVLGRELSYRKGGAVGPAFGAARLARLAVHQGSIASVCAPPPITQKIVPNPALSDQLARGRARFKEIYPAIKDKFPH